MRAKRLTTGMATLLGLASIATQAVAQAPAAAWPTKPVRVIVGFPAGGGTDATARAYAEKLSMALGQQFVVDNRVGASGMIGHEACAKAPNDGYTLCVNTLGAMALLPHVRKTPYDPLKDFAAIGRVTDALFGFAVNANSPWKTMQDFVEEAKRKPDTLTLANSGLGTITHLSGETMASLYNIKLVMVPYKGGVEQLQDALAGHVSMMFEGNFFPHVKAGKLRGLAVSTPFRHPNFPDIPSMKELQPDWDVPSWFGFMAPAGTPQAVIDKVSPLLNKASEMADVQERVLGMGLVALKDTPQGMADDLRKQHTRYGEAVKRLNIKVE